MTFFEVFVFPRVFFFFSFLFSFFLSLKNIKPNQKNLTQA